MRGEREHESGVLSKSIFLVVLSLKGYIQLLAAWEIAEIREHGDTTTKKSKQVVKKPTV